MRTPFNNLIGAQFIHFSSITLPSTNYWMNPLVAVMVFTAVKSVGNLVPLVLVDWMGRKPLMVVSHATMALVTAAYGAGLYVVAYGPVDKPLAWWPVVSLWAYASAYALGAGTLAYTLLGEMFAANVKTRAAPLCVMFLAGTSFLLDCTYTTITQALGVYANYFMYSAFNLVWAVAAAFVMVETKGKTFLEINQTLAS